MEKAIFNRQALLLGDEAMERIGEKRVILFGVGGVGSWCAESLVRSGIRHLTIVDCDKVCITNVNRQLQATIKTVGMVKVDVLRDRLLEINPDAEVNAVQEIYTEENADMFHLDDYDYIIDAIDSLQHKANLILRATECNGKLFSAMGAALKMDPTKVQVAEFWKVQGCPLARAVRNKFKSIKKFPSKKFQCVYSPELLSNKGNPEIAANDKTALKPLVNGTVAHITAIFGFTLAGLVIQDIVGD